MNFDNDLMLFFRTIYEDSENMDECSAKVKSAVAAVADKLDIVRAELAVKMPATKLCEVNTFFRFQLRPCDIHIQK